MKKNLAFVFPGQGSQSVGMLSDLYKSSEQVQRLFNIANNSLGYNLWSLIENGPKEALNKTIHAQPALLVADIAVWQTWLDQGGDMPAVMAGHSLGEYSALVAAGCLTFEDALKIVSKRAELMQEAVPEGEGAMAAILGLDDVAVEELCQKVSPDGKVSPANFNSPGQVVISGAADAVDAVAKLAKAAGAKRAIVLPVSVPSHCYLMKPAAIKFTTFLDDFKFSAPTTPILNNVDVMFEQEPNVIRDALIRQLYSPVRWQETITKMYSTGVDTIIECGPGKVLSGLNKRIIKDLSVSSIQSPEDISALLSSLS